MAEAVPSSRLVRFGTFEVDLQAGELRKSGVRLKLTGQPLQVLTILLERAGEVVTREELQKRLWPDTFVDVDHNLNTAVNRIREVLGDSAESPRFVETLAPAGVSVHRSGRGWRDSRGARRLRAAARIGRPWRRAVSILVVILVLLAASGLFIYTRRQVPESRLPSGRLPASLLTTGYRSAPPGRRTAASSPTVPTVGENSISGCKR